MKKCFWLAACACLFTSALSLSTTAFADTIDQVIVFGDSLSDNGNIYNLTADLHKVTSSIPIIPKDPPYYQGRFSNGPVWIEDLALGMQVPLVDYAYGGSWAEPLQNSKFNIPFGLGMQVDYYLMANITDRHKDQHLYVIWTGANDYIDTRDNVDEATSNVVNTIESNLDWLIYYGAKNVLVLNLPDLSTVPYANNADPNTRDIIKQLVTLHNTKLAVMIANTKKTYPGVKIVIGDSTQTFADILAHPSDYQMKNVTDSCYTGDYSLRALQNAKEIADAKKQGIDIMRMPSLRVAYQTAKLAEDDGKVCANPDEYLFWDKIHPTRVVHNLTAISMAAQLAENGIAGPVQK